MATMAPRPAIETAVNRPTAANAKPPATATLSAMAPQHTIAATTAVGARFRSRIEYRLELIDGRGSGRAVGGLVQPAGQTEQLVPRRKGVLAVDQDRWRAPEPGSLCLLGSGHKTPLHRETTTACETVEAFGGDLPVRAVIEVQEFELHGVPSRWQGSCDLGAIVNLPSQWKVKGVSLRIGELAAQSGVT